MFKSRVPNSDVSTSFGCTVAKLVVATLAGIVARQGISEGIKGRLSLKHATLLEDGIVLVQNPIETRGRDQVPSR